MLKKKTATRPAPADIAALDLMEDEDYAAGVRNLADLNRRLADLDQRVTAAADAVRHDPGADLDLSDLLVGDDGPQRPDAPKPAENLHELRAERERVKAAIQRQHAVNAKLKNAALAAAVQRLRPHYGSVALRLAEAATGLIELLHDEARIRRQVNAAAPDIFGSRLQAMGDPSLQEALGKLLARAQAGGFIARQDDPAPSPSDPDRSIVLATTAMAGTAGVTRPGDLLVVPHAEAKRLIAAGFAMSTLPPRRLEDADVEEAA